jgi:hypothetical protein
LIPNGDIGSKYLTIQGCVGTDCDSTEFQVEYIEADFSFVIPENEKLVIINMNQEYSNILLSDYTNKEDLIYNSSLPENFNISVDNTSRVHIVPDQDWTGQEEVMFSACNIICKYQEMIIRVI